MSPTDLTALLSFATAETHFLFRGCFMIKWIAFPKGFTLSPVLANLSLGIMKKTGEKTNHPLKFRSIDAMLTTPFV